MIIKRPKTSNNFGLFEDIGHLRTGYRVETDKEIKEIKDRDETLWKDAWEMYLDTPLNFWTLVSLLETTMYEKEDRGTFTTSLSHFGNPIKNPNLFEKFDKHIYGEISGHDLQLENGASFQYTLYRISEACGLFLAFDVKEISFSQDTDDILTDIFEKIISQARQSSKYGNELDRDLFMTQVNYLQKEYLNNSIYSHGVGYGIIPDTNDHNFDFNIILSLLGDYLDIEFEYDKDNSLELHKYLYSHTMFAVSLQRDLYIAKIVRMIPQCEVIGSLIRIPSKLILEADFPMIKFLWYLSLDDLVYIFDWTIDDYLDVSVGPQPALMKAIGMDTSVKENKKITGFHYDPKKEELFCDNKKIVLTDINKRFLVEFFDLLHQNTNSIEFDVLAEKMDDSFESQTPEKQSKMIRAIYDRIKAINDTIAMQCGYNDFLKAKQKKVMLSEPDILN